MQYRYCRKLKLKVKLTKSSQTDYKITEYTESALSLSLILPVPPYIDVHGYRQVTATLSIYTHLSFIRRFRLVVNLIGDNRSRAGRSKRLINKRDFLFSVG